MTMRMLYHYDIWSKVPLEGSASYADVAAATKLPESIIRRFIRVAMNMHMFREESPGSDRIVHTAASAYIVREPVFKSFIGHCMEDAGDAAVRGVDALDKFFVGHAEATEETIHAPSALAYPGRTLWEVLADDEGPGKPKGYRATRLAEAMQAISKSSAVATEEAVNVFDWDSLGEAKVVDVSISVPKRGFLFTFYKTWIVTNHIKPAAGWRIKRSRQRTTRQATPQTELHRSGSSRGRKGLP